MSLIKGLLLFFSFSPMETTVSTTSVTDSAVTPSSNPNTAMTANSTTSVTASADGLYDIGGGVMVDKETYDIIKGADVRAIKPTRNLIPEIKVVSTDKQVLEFQNILGTHVPKGQFVAVTYDENGDKVYKLIGATFQAVILKNTNAYSLYDETKGESTYYSNEYEFGVQPRVMIKESETGKIMFDGTQKTVKDWMLKFFPGKPSSDGRETHQFSFRNVIYVALPELINGDGASAVFRLMLSHTSLDGINQFKETISGDPMKYLAEFSTTPKLTGGNMSFPLTVKLAGGPEVLAKMGYLVPIAKMKKDLDAFVLEAQEHFFHGELKAKTEELPAVSNAPALPPQPVKPVEPAT